MRRAALDLRFGHDSLAIDAIEFLRDSGRWLANSLFAIDTRSYEEEVAALVLRRQRSTGRVLPIPKIRGGG